MDGKSGRRRHGVCAAAASRRAAWRPGSSVAVAALLTLPLQAEAQKTTFVSNTGQSTATSLRGIGPTGIGSFFYSQAQRFSTGSNEGGYTLSAIQVQADNFESASSPRVSIYTVTSDNPGTLLYVLTNPATLNDNAINTFRAPANATLEKDTDYFVVFEATGSGSNTRYDLKGTVSANEDSGTASGWSIADTSRERATNSGNWSSVFARLKIAVRGTIPPSHLDRGRQRRRERRPPHVRRHALASLPEHGEGRLRDDFGRHRHRRRRLPCSPHLHPRHSGGR